MAILLKESYNHLGHFQALHGTMSHNDRVKPWTTEIRIDERVSINFAEWGSMTQYVLHVNIPSDYIKH